MTDYEKLAYKIFKDIEPISYLEEKYKKRNTLGLVTRFAPSPTGFVHTGSLFAALISYRMAKQTNGVFYFRLEDTDTKREVDNSKYQLLDELKSFGIIPDEGYLGDKEEGLYGPYTQSNRKFIYDIVINELIKRNLAYPCFCNNDELNKCRCEQESLKVRTGYYGKWAKCRDLSPLEAIKKIDNNEPYIIRFKSHGNFNNKIKVHDLIRGDLELSQNDLDIVIRKSDFLPTYHFAHLCDDHFMRTTTVIRGEEWLPSLPIHLELFDALGFERPSYAHLPVIMKLDNGKRRKLSKRHDPEASVSYFLEKGYPIEAILEYLFTIANSNYEEWRMNNKSYDDFIMTFDKMSLDGALFDMNKINSISKELLGSMTKEEIAKRSYEWALEYDNNLKEFIESDYDYYVKIMGLEREKENPRKDYEKYSDILTAIQYFNLDNYLELISTQNIAYDSDIINSYLSSLDCSNEDEWLDYLKEKANTLGYCINNKEYKANKEKYKGNFGAFMGVIRLLVTGRSVSQNLYHIGKIIGKENLEKRFEKAIEIISKK